MQRYLEELKRRIRIRKHKVTTLHYMFPLMAATFGILGATYLADVSSSYVILTPNPTYVEAGDSVEVIVEAVAHIPVNTVDIEVAFPSDLKVTGVETGGSVITLWTTEPKPEGNKVVLRGGVYRKGFIGRHTIARINAKAVTAGNADVLVRNSIFLAGDGKATPIAINSSDNQKAAIQIGTATGVAGHTTALTGKVAVSIITDIDGDKDVDFNDIQVFMNAWRTGIAIYDFSGDGKMTFRDFAIILADAFFK